jgi:hypothetical protein
MKIKIKEKYMTKLELLKPEQTSGIENHPEALEMKKNIVQRAKVLVDQNSELVPKISRADWNRFQKEKSLEELKDCEHLTKVTVEEFTGTIH